MNRGNDHVPAGTSKRRAVLIFFAALLSAALVAIALVPRRPGTLDRAKAAYARGDYATASRLVDAVLPERPSDEALVLGARLALIKRRPEDALRLLRRVADDRGVEGVDTLFECGKMCGELGSLGDAERYLRMAVVHAPGYREANYHLLDLMRIEGRNWEAYELAANVFPPRQFRLKHLELVGTLRDVWLDEAKDQEFLAYCETVTPEDPLPQLGLIRLMLAKQHEVGRAKKALLKAVAAAPELCEAQATLGEFLLDSGEDVEFLQWHAKLPSTAERHPSIWVIRGRWSRLQGDTEGAIRCLWEAIRRFPNDRASNLLIAKLLVSVGRDQDAVPFQQRGELLVAFDQLLVHYGRAPATLTEMIQLLEKLERRWEAIGWCQILLQTDPYSQFARETIDRLEMQWKPGREGTPSANPSLAIDLANYPLPHLQLRERTASSHAGAPRASALSFHESASEVGLDFRYFVEDERLQTEVYTFDFSGGGVSVLDYDCDGWPDLYLTQSRHWLAGKDGAEPRNALFRNVHGEFVDVAESANVGDQEFGQGAAAGDFNCDGFPDLYVTNLGANVFYLNNGDGTYQDITETSGTGGEGNSLSAALADFSGDGLPDLYVVNYLDRATEQPCPGQGKPTGCGPHLLLGQPDRLYLNLGNGEWRDVAEPAGIPLPQGAGKGMGLLVADFDGQAGLDIYVANDMTANRLYVNQGAAANPISFVEQGRVAGVAYDESGTLQGSMGIAARDLKQNGMLDVFVSNFYNERNNLFSQSVQKPSLLFNDLSLDMNLAMSSVNEVGWGAQFLDAELDGDWDLFVANGDINDNMAIVGKMYPRMFENLGGARFEPRPAACDFFQTRNYGRAVARLDWNRDGLDDVCVTHRGAPVALLTNTSQRLGHFIAIVLIGVECSRDAVGAVAEVEAGARRWSVQLMAGDGFSATNQRQILLGLGAQTEVDKLTIRWPQGDPQSFEHLPADRQWIVVQGHDSPIHRR